jgi:hypothetical protein
MGRQHGILAIILHHQFEKILLSMKQNRVDDWAIPKVPHVLGCPKSI